MSPGRERARQRHLRDLLAVAEDAEHRAPQHHLAARERAHLATAEGHAVIAHHVVGLKPAGHGYGILSPSAHLISFC